MVELNLESVTCNLNSAKATHFPLLLLSAEDQLAISHQTKRTVAEMRHTEFIA